MAIKEVGKLEPIYQSNSTGLILFSTGFKNILGYQSLAVGGVIPRISPRTTQLVAGVEDTASDQKETTEAGESLGKCFERSLEEKYMNGNLHCSCEDQEILKTCGNLEEARRAMDKFGIERPEVRYTFGSATNVTPPGFPTGWTPLVPANKEGQSQKERWSR